MRILLSILLISFLLTQPSQASPKLYQYDGDLPFIEMMLNMMTAMGMIDKVPSDAIGYGNNYNNPYMANAFTPRPGFYEPNMWQGIGPNTMTRPPCINNSCGKKIQPN